MYSDNSVIKNNTIKNCNGRGITIAGNNILIEGNTIDTCYQGVGIFSAITADSQTTYGTWLEAGTETLYGITIKNNSFKTMVFESTSFNGNAINLRAADGYQYVGVVISGSTILDVQYSGIRGVNLVQTVIDGNVFRGYVYDAIYISGNSTLVDVRRNYFNSDTDGLGHIVRFDTTSDVIADVEENYFTLSDLLPSYYQVYVASGLTRVMCLNNENLYIVGPAWPVVVKRNNFNWSTTAPTSGTYCIGDFVPKTPAASSFQGWLMCSRQGTLGTLSGVTGSITTGTNQLTVNSATSVVPPRRIKITGAGAASADLTTTVCSVDGNVVTLWDNASTTVSGAAVAFVAPDVCETGVTGAAI